MSESTQSARDRFARGRATSFDDCRFGSMYLRQYQSVKTRQHARDLVLVIGNNLNTAFLLSVEDVLLVNAAHPTRAETPQFRLRLRRAVHLSASEWRSQLRPRVRRIGNGRHTGWDAAICHGLALGVGLLSG